MLILNLECKHLNCGNLSVDKWSVHNEDAGRIKSTENVGLARLSPQWAQSLAERTLISKSIVSVSIVRRLRRLSGEGVSRASRDLWRLFRVTRMLCKDREATPWAKNQKWDNLCEIVPFHNNLRRENFSTTSA